MAKYNLETETTVHLKGMTFGEPSGGDTPMGGGNYVILNEKNSQIGVADNYYVIDTDECVYTLFEPPYEQKGLSSSQYPLAFLLNLSAAGFDVSEFVDRIGNPAINLDALDMLRYAFGGNAETIFFADTIAFASMAFNPNRYEGFISKGFYPFLRATSLKENGDSRDWDAIESEEAAKMEGSIRWFEDVRFYFAVPRYNEECMRNLIKAHTEKIINSASTMSLKPFSIGRPNML